MGAQKRLFAYITVLCGGLCSAFALPETQPVLTNATWSGNQFQFTLHGETNVSYILESSSDLRAWTSAITNSDSQATRTIIVPAASSQTFWRVRPVPGPLFEHALLALGPVNLNGSGIIDTFNSTNSMESTAGQYDPAKATDRASVATTSRSQNAIFVGNMSIYGSVSTGPGATVRVSPSGNVGSTAYNNNPAYNGTIEPGHYRDDFQVVLPEPRLPADFGPALPVTAATVPLIGGTNYKFAILSDGDYQMGSISVGIGERMLINAKARLHVLGSTTVANSGYILLGAAASIEWYAGGQVSFGGGGCINASGLARNFSIVGLSTNSILYGAQARFNGTIYAPRAPVTLGGTVDAIGAIVSTNFTLTGTMSLHFDESLKSAGPVY
jgi:hypothetical protein